MAGFECRKLSPKLKRCVNTLKQCGGRDEGVYHRGREEFHFGDERNKIQDRILAYHGLKDRCEDVNACVERRSM
jgi:hypothetical protein